MSAVPIIASLRDYRMRPESVPETVTDSPAPAEREELMAQIRSLVREKGAVLVAHYYTDPDLQILADETGGHVSDSLDMARYGHDSNSDLLVVCGVRFMGETAKILNPEKRVLMPDLHAECSLDIGCPPEEFASFCDTHPDRTVVVYANTSAAVKARADWMVTSGTAVDVVNHLKDRGKRIIWAPDRYLGEYVQSRTGADMLLWQGACVVHEEFKGKELRELRRRHPDARVLVHPESPPSVIEQADVVASTSGLIRAARDLRARKFIVATDRGLFHKMREAAPDRIFIEAPTFGRSATCRSCAHCPWMAMNTLTKLARVLESGSNEIRVDPDLARRARRSIERLLEFAAARRQMVYGNNDA